MGQSKTYFKSQSKGGKMFRGKTADEMSSAASAFLKECKPERVSLGLAGCGDRFGVLSLGTAPF